MKALRSITNEHYEVRSIDGLYGLGIDGQSNHSFDELVEQINLVVERAKQRGYDNDEKWLIMKSRFHREWDERGWIKLESSEMKAYAFYDNGKITMLDER